MNAGFQTSQRSLCALFLFLATIPALAGPTDAVVSVGLTVSDLDRSVEFFSTVLSFEKLKETEIVGPEYEQLFGVFGMRARMAIMQLGNERIELMQFLAPEGRPMPADSRGNDRWFQHMAIVVSDMDKAYQLLRLHKVRHASTGPQTLPTWNANAGGIKAFYFKDPDGHFLEVIWFPPGKGDPRWQKPTDRLFLGIDHTAITVADTDASLAFWRDQLGLQPVGGAENYGTEQEHLNNVFGARLRITTLKAAGGMGVEFLEYLAPGDGRPAPLDTKSNDIWNWYVRVQARDPSAVSGQLRKQNANLVSPVAVDVPDPILNYGQACMARDPDGHAVLVATLSLPAPSSEGE